MAPMSILIPFLFIATLLLSLQVNARDSQFFSKVTPLNNNNNNLKETEVPNNEAPLNKPEQQPTFIPETENSYGLYGHETGLHPPTTTTTNAAPYTTTTTYKPYKTTTAEEDIANTKYSSNNNFDNFNKDAFGKQNELSDTKYTEEQYKPVENQNNNNNNYFYNNNNDAFGKQNELSDTKYTEEQYKPVENQNNHNNNYSYNNNNNDAFGKQNELSDTKFTEGEYNSMENQNNNNDNKYFYNNNAANEKYYYNNNAVNEKYYYNNNNDDANNRYYKPNAVNNNYNAERQGLSDTRFIEGGKYFYDLNTGKYNHPTLNGDPSRGVNTENWYNNRGYFGNNNVNTIGGNQKQEEFEEDQDDFEP